MPMATRRRRDDLSPRGRGRNYRPLILILVIAAVLGLGGYWFLNPQLAPGWVRQYLPQAPARLYKWQDQSGQIQYSNQPPPAGVPFEQVDYWEDANVIPALPTPESSQ